MADIKTRDAVKGTIKTIDKAAVASTPPPNMPPIKFQQLRSASRTRAFISSTSKVKKE